MADVGLYNLVGLLLLVFGYLIKYKRQVRLIAGYDARKVRDAAGLADWVGTKLLWLAGFSFVMAVLAYLLPGFNTATSIIFVVVVAGTCLYTAAGGQRFTHAGAGHQLTAAAQRELREPAPTEPPVAQFDERGRTPTERAMRS